jgi:hypothetical protein
MRAVVQVIAQHRQILWRGNDQYLAQATKHQRSQRIADHRLIVDREKLLADDLREREKTGSGAASEKDGFLHFRFSIFDFRSLWLQRKSNSAHSCQKRVPAVKSNPLF